MRYYAKPPNRDDDGDYEGRGDVDDVPDEDWDDTLSSLYGRGEVQIREFLAVC